MHLEYRLRNIETNRANFVHGRLPSTCFHRNTVWHFDAANGAASTAPNCEELSVSECLPSYPGKRTLLNTVGMSQRVPSNGSSLLTRSPRRQARETSAVS